MKKTITIVKDVARLTRDTLSLKGPHPLKNDYKKTLRLTQVQRNIIVGTLLGDGHLEVRSKNNHPRYCFNQKEAQQSYVCHVYEHFRDWCSKEPQVVKSGVNLQGQATLAYYFKTCTHPALEFYANQFYTEGSQSRRIKVVPNLLHRWLNPQVLAYWYMDDGHKDGSGYMLNSQNYTLEEQEILADALGRKFGFEVNIRKDRAKYRLYITAKSRDAFTKIVKPFILPSFEYKLQ